MDTTTADGGAPHPAASLGRGRRLLTLAVLSLCVLTTVTFEVTPVGSLTAIAADLGTDEGGAGLLMSVYGGMVVVGAIPLSALVARFSARRTLAVTLLVFALSAAGLALSTSLATAMGARVLGGLAHAVLFTCTFRVTLDLAGSRRPHTTAASVASIGTALALSAGLPATSALGTATGWTTPVRGLVVAFLVLAVAVLLLVPRSAGAPAPGTSTSSTFHAMRQAPLLRVGATVAVVVLGQFVSYTYLEPLLRDAGASPATVGLVLVGYGSAGVVGLVLVNRPAEHRPRALLALLVTALALVLVLVALVPSTGVVAALVVAWGLLFGAAPVLLQVIALRSTDSASAAPGLVNSTFNIGITLGSVVGGQVIAAAEVGVLPLVSAAILAVSLLLVLRPSWLRADDAPLLPRRPAARRSPSA